MVVVSISGIRGIINQDLNVSGLLAPIQNFASLQPAQEFLVGRDTRSTGQMIQGALMGSLVARGVNVIDYGIVSTPALFRESRLRLAPAVMITASHNEPEWNGIKLIVRGQGISEDDLEKISGPPRPRVENVTFGTIRARKPSYNAELIEMGGLDSCKGVKVALDLNGGTSVNHAPAVMSALGCDLSIIGGTQGVFERTIDPTADDLRLLRETVQEKNADVGFAFDCDGDRLVLVDKAGMKKTGDFMLTLAITKMLPSLQNRSVVVSVDTTQAIEDVVNASGGKVFKSKVGEANVVSKMIEMGATLGGEGSSGGLIDGSYNYCRDSMLAAIAITKEIAKSGTRMFKDLPSYAQVRLKAPMNRKKALEAIKRLQKENPDSDQTDGVKLELSQKSWVLIRVSGTEDAVRVSAESKSHDVAQHLAESYLKRVKNLG